MNIIVQSTDHSFIVVVIKISSRTVSFSSIYISFTNSSSHEKPDDMSYNVD